MITAACTLCACEKELDFRYHDIAPINVIESYVSDEECRQSSRKQHRSTSR